MPESIGHDGGTYLVIGPDGPVVARDPLGVLRDRYVNRSAVEFARSLRLFAAGWQRGSELSEGEARTQSEHLLRALEEIDQSAFADPENWWAVVMEQLIFGLI